MSFVLLAGCASETGEEASSARLFSFSDIVDEVMPSVVFIYVELQAPGSDQVIRGSGSGVILSPDGYILTNRHVVEGAGRVEVTLQDRSVYDATGVWEDDILDLAVVNVNRRSV